MYLLENNYCENNICNNDQPEEESEVNLTLQTATRCIVLEGGQTPSSRGSFRKDRPIRAHSFEI